MTTPTITDYLKYANLQMAAEAFLVDNQGKPLTGQLYIDALKKGNGHASVFTETQAKEFVMKWEVVDQIANMPSGFSGTLFRNKANPNELAISFRSTEFIDDAIRDNVATNILELKTAGFAWGQLADMETWYGDLKSSGKITGGNSTPKETTSRASSIS